MVGQTADSRENNTVRLGSVFEVLRMERLVSGVLGSRKKGDRVGRTLRELSSVHETEEGRSPVFEPLAH